MQGKPTPPASGSERGVRERAITDEEIIAPGRLVFPNGGEIQVDSIFRGAVCYRRWMPGAEEADWLRTPIVDFVRLVKAESGERAAAAPPHTAGPG